MNVRAIHTRLFLEHESLVGFSTEHIPHIPDGSILVVTSKIAALSEGRTAFFKSAKDKERIIRSESEMALKTKHTWLTVKDGIVLASAGVDESNANGRLILLPKNSFAIASRLRTALKKHYGIKKLGIILADSRILLLRAGSRTGDCVC
jgi:F420-0:gamma-glutamyl ligase